MESWNSSAGVTASWTAMIRFQAGKDFYLLHSINTDSRAHPPFYTMGTGDSVPGNKAAESRSWPLT